MPATPGAMINAMSVDVEDYYQVSAFEKLVSVDRWPDYPSRVAQNMNRVLDLFAEADIKSTFFTLGWVAERHPEIVRRIVEEGHELASHGWCHVRASDQPKADFRADVTRTKQALEDIGGCEVKGYRAASYSITRENLWALDELAEAGYLYSSSIFPIRHDHYGIPEAPRSPFRINGSGLLEIPVTTMKLRERNYPCAGGGWFRLFPYVLFRQMLRRVNQSDQLAGVFYFHPWEIDPDQPRLDGLTRKTRFRHYINLQRMEAKLLRLLSDFRWDRMDRVFLQNDYPSLSLSQISEVSG